MSEKWAVMWGKKAFRMEHESERESGRATKCCSKGSTVGGLCGRNGKGLTLSFSSPRGRMG